MKDFVLSLLSRGYSQVVQTDGAGHNGKLEVCFEPEDYFNWRSQAPLLRLSSGEGMLSVVEPTLPKTYSTRRGPLILYSEDLALTSCQPVKVSRKGRALRTSRDEAEIQLHTLQDLTEAILLYGKKQCEAKLGCNSSLSEPLLPAGKRATHHLQSYWRPGEERDHVTELTGEGKEKCTFLRDQGDPVWPREGQVRYQPRFLCVPRPQWPLLGPLPPITPGLAPKRCGHRPHQTLGETVTFTPSEPETKLITRDIKSFKPTTELRRVQMSAISEAESSAEEEWAEQPQCHMVAERLAACPKDINAQWNGGAIEPGGEGKGRAPRPAYTALCLGCSHLSGVSNDRKHTEEACQQDSIKQCGTNTHMRRVTVPTNPSYNLFHLPPISQELSAGSNSRSRGLRDCKVCDLKAGGKDEESQEGSGLRLPDIRFPAVSTEAQGPKPSERTTLRKVLVLLPSLTEPSKSHKPYDGSHDVPEEAVREEVLYSDVDQRADPVRREEPLKRDCPFKGAQDLLIWFEPQENKETTPGLLPPIAGHRGPGKQSSMALYRQDPAEQMEPQSSIIRGSIPQELRECQKGRALGTLIMGPAGEIIRLSLWDPLTDTEDHPVLDDATREHVLRVMTSEGVLEQPWTILLEEQILSSEAVKAAEAEARPGHQKQAASTKEAVKATEAEAKPSHQKQAASTKGKSMALPPQLQDLLPSCTLPAQTTSVPLDYTKAVEKPKTFGTDRNEVIEMQSCALEKGSGKVKGSAEQQHYSSKGADTKTQSRGRMQGLQPEGGGIPGSPQSKSMSASSLQRTALANPTAAEELSHQAKAKPQMESFKHSVSSLGKTRSRKAGGRDNAEDIKMKKGKRRIEPEQLPRRFTEGKKSKKSLQINMSTELLEAEVTADPAPDGLIRKKKKTKAEGEKPKAEPTKSQSRATKVNKKVKGQAAFVVGKPRTSQEVQQTRKEADSPERTVKTASDAELKEPEEDLSDDHDHDHCCGVPRPSLDDDVLSACQEDHISTVSPRSFSSADWQTPASTESSRGTSRAVQTGPCSPAPLSLAQPSPRPSALVHQVHHSASTLSKSLSSAEVTLSQAKGNDEAMNVRESKTTAVAQKAEQRRLEVERKRKEKEEERRRQQECEEREERIRLELVEDQKQRSEQARLRKFKEEEERRREEETERERLRRQQAELERERRRQEEKRRLLERLQRERQEKEQQRAAEMKRQQQEEETRRQEEWTKLQEMEENERVEYLHRQREEEEGRRKAEEEKRRAEEEVARRNEQEARALAELFARQRSALEQQLRFHRGLFVEAGGLEQTQDISRPWVFSYFTLLKLLGFVEGCDNTQNAQSGC